MTENKLKILVVEDSPTQMLALKTILAGKGFEVDGAADLASGMERLKGERWDLVILDLSLPDSSGLATVKRTHSHAPTVPIIVLTSTADEEAAAQALQEGAQDYLVKGQVDDAALVRSVRYAVERQRAQEALHESEERFHLLVDGAIDYAIFLLDAGGHIVTWNAGAERMTGFSEAEIIGKHVSVFYTPEDIEQRVPQLALEKAVLEGRIEDERWRLRSDGSRFWANIVTTALRDQAGNVRGFARIARDITERKRANEILREKEILRQKNLLVELLQSVTVGINLATTAESVVFTCLEQVCAHTKWTAGRAHLVVGGSDDELLVKTIWYTGDNDESTLSPDRHEDSRLTRGSGLGGRAWAEARLVWSGDLSEDPSLSEDEYVRQEGLKSCLAMPIGEGGGITAILEFLSEDDTEPDQPLLEIMTNIEKQLGVAVERRRLEEAVIHQAAELAHSNAELQEFAKIAAHDLQEPLRTTQGFLNLLVKRYKGQLDPDADRFIQFIEDAMNRMAQLIQNVLDHSRIGAKPKPLEKVDCSAAFNEAIANLSFSIQESDAKVTADALPAVLADRLHMIQLFQNLIGNAIKFRGEEPPEIHVKAERKERDWLFAIRDNGIGIDKRFDKRIFAIFSRLHGKTEYSGTGIGLAICKKIVEYYGGSIWVESEPGKGSTFLFTLPAERQS